MTVVLYEATCCRAWPVMLGAHIGRCGYCNERPIVTGMWSR